MATVKPWTFKEAQDLIVAMRPKINGYGYEVTIGGGVLNKGQSANDLDLFLLPKGDIVPQPTELLMWVISKFGLGKSIAPAYSAHPAAQAAAAQAALAKINVKESFQHKIRFDLAGRKIDVFVV